MLKTQISCEIEDLIGEVTAKADKPYDEVEKAMFKTHIFPESRKTFLTTKFGPIIDEKDAYPWLEKALQDIFTELQIDGLYVTTAI